MLILHVIDNCTHILWWISVRLGNINPIYWWQHYAETDFMHHLSSTFLNPNILSFQNRLVAVGGEGNHISLLTIGKSEMSCTKTFKAHENRFVFVSSYNCQSWSHCENERDFMIHPWALGRLVLIVNKLHNLAKIQ